MNNYRCDAPIRYVMVEDLDEQLISFAQIHAPADALLQLAALLDRNGWGWCCCG